MHARNRKTGAAIIGTLERLTGRAEIIADSFKFAPDGSLSAEPEPFDWEGGTEIFYDEQKTALDAKGRTIYLDENGDECTAEDIEAYDPDADEEDEPPRLDDMPAEPLDLAAIDAAIEHLAGRAPTETETNGTPPNAAERATERRAP